MEARLELAALESGGSPDWPIEVASASVVEPHAGGLPCAACGERIRVEEHRAVTINDARGDSKALRVVEVRCTRCGSRRNVYFRLGTTLAS